MGAVFRKKYQFGEVIPLVKVFVGIEIDIYEDDATQNPAGGGPQISAQGNIDAGPIKFPVKNFDLGNNTKQSFKLVDVPVALLQSIEVDLVLNIVDYNWQTGQNAGDGVVTFKIVVLATAKALGLPPISLHLAAEPVSITIGGAQTTADFAQSTTAAATSPHLQSLASLYRDGMKTLGVA